MDFIPDLDEFGSAAIIAPLLVQCVIIAFIWPFVRKRTERFMRAVAITFATTLIVDIVLLIVLFVAFGIVFRLANPSLN